MAAFIILKRNLLGRCVKFIRAVRTKSTDWTAQTTEIDFLTVLEKSEIKVLPEFIST